MHITVIFDVQVRINAIFYYTFKFMELKKPFMKHKMFIRFYSTLENNFNVNIRVIFMG